MEIINQYFNFLIQKMDRAWYLILCIYIWITFRTILMWIDKMSKVIIWNYITWITCVAFWNLIHQWIIRLMSSPDTKFIWLSYSQYANFLSTSQLTLVLLLYIGLIRLIYSCGKFQVSYSTRTSTEKLYFIILIPITVLSFIIWPYIALQSDWIQVLNFIEKSITWTFWFLISFINHIPFWMFVNWIAFTILSSHINFKISLSAKATKLPEWI
jgi:hypothetical protein